MRGRRSRAATLEDITEARNRAAETISELAEHAVAIAREAGKNAASNGQARSRGLEPRARARRRHARGHRRASSRATDASAPRATRRASASPTRPDKLSTAIRPKKKTHRVRNLLIGAAVVGGIFALIQSPLRTKIQERLFGPPPEDDDLPQITLPDDDHEIEVSRRIRIDVSTRLIRSPSPLPMSSARPVVAEPTHASRPQPRPRRTHRPGDQCLTTAPIRDVPLRTVPQFSGPRQNFSGPRPSLSATTRGRRSARRLEWRFPPRR